MIVVAILGILAAIATVAFARTREPAVDRSAQALLTNAVQTVRVVEADTKTLADVTVPQLADAEPSVRWQDDSSAPEAARHEVSVAIGADSGVDYVVVATHTGNGECLAVREADDSATLYQRVPGDTCAAGAFNPAFGWVTQWPPR